MRLVLSLGSMVIFLGMGFLWFFWHAWFIWLVSHATFFPPDDPDDIGHEFALLAAQESNVPGVTIGDIAQAHVQCIPPGQPAVVRVAFRRVNLVLVGAGAESLSPLISPDVHRLEWLRPDLTGEDGTDPPPLSKAERERVNQVLEDLSKPDSPVLRGVQFHNQAEVDRLHDLIFAMALDEIGYRHCAAAKMY